MVATHYDLFMPREAVGDRKHELAGLIHELTELGVTATLDSTSWPEVLWVIIPQGTTAETVGGILLLATVHYRHLGLNSIGVTPSMHNGSVALRFK